MGVDGGGPPPAEMGIKEVSAGRTTAVAPAKEPPKELTPADRAVNKALKGIDDSAKDLLGADVTEDQIKKAKENAEKRIRTEFKELEGKDPMSRIEQAAEAVAVTDAEKDFVKLFRNRMEWRRGLVFPAVQEGLSYNDPYTIVRNVGRTDDGIEFRRIDDQTIKILAKIEAFDENSFEPRVKLEDFEGFKERFLRELGVLEEDQNLKDLIQNANSLPRYQYEEYGMHLPTAPQGPYIELQPSNRSKIETGWIAGLPTKIEGVYARIKPYGPIEFAMSKEALQKVQSPSRSR